MFASLCNIKEVKAIIFELFGKIWQENVYKTINNVIFESVVYLE